MTDPSATHDAAVTDRAILTESAYKTEQDLAARQSLYQWQTPSYDLPGLVAEHLRDVRGTVVDVGCGNGMFIKRLVQERPDLRLLGLDVSLGILDGVPRPVAVADAARLPLATGSVDAALALHMLYHVEDIPAAVAELDRVVTGGLLIASTNSERDKVELDRLWERAAGDVLGVDKGPSRISLSARFSLEKAPGLLGAAFPKVEIVELPGTISVATTEPVIAHMNSYRAWADQHEVPFEATIDRAREIVTEHISRQGSFEITCLGGILICPR
ncbi:class I SAM-dependent methyltransferase [Streptomyces fulvoviolaceus]|uniref:class I SAM-dependent methyltransferase n=1 Tax=Streptomyces fulvoviolaceus TaxID=285535 RepID=UPI0004CB5CCE|nr:class I SAM-dependent methyltransferase [Streptomyces fulvoviolaceus]